jgi:hypothetical protein
LAGKTCFKCDTFKPLDEFYPHPRMADGHLNKCKECTKRDVKTRYDEKPEMVVAYERERARTPHRRAKAAEYLRTFRARYPEKNRARQLISAALRTGKIERRPCEACGSTDRVEAHHDDYSRPLDVRWFCFTHHREVAHGQRTYSVEGV